MQVHVFTADWSRDRDTLRAIREQVFIVEQNVPRDLEWDGEDDVSTHFLAVNEAGQAIGCARLLPSGQIGRMAVLAEHRRGGLGRRLLDAAVDEAKRQGLARVHLHAQVHAAGFYRHAGFLPEGGEFMEAGIPHQAMALELPIAFEPAPGAERPKVRRAPSAAPGREPAALRQYRGEKACRDALGEWLQQARRRVAILSPQLDHALYDAPSVVESVSSFARRTANAEVRILIADSSLIVGRGHRLVELARRLDSRLEIRRVSDDTPPGEGSFVTWDERGFFLMPDHREYTAAANGYDPVQAKHLLEAFDYLWSRAGPDPELRLLTL